jgi:hypothetical protein
MKGAPEQARYIKAETRTNKIEYFFILYTCYKLNLIWLN